KNVGDGSPEGEKQGQGRPEQEEPFHQRHPGWVKGTPDKFQNPSFKGPGKEKQGHPESARAESVFFHGASRIRDHAASGFKLAQASCREEGSADASTTLAGVKFVSKSPSVSILPKNGCLGLLRTKPARAQRPVLRASCGEMTQTGGCGPQDAYISFGLVQRDRR